jgi:hypothetical protein
MTKDNLIARIHPLAELFPMMPADEFAKLKADIQKNGQMEPIWINSEGTLLDGRNRWNACKELGIVPNVVSVREIGIKSGPDADADYIWSKNILRRHLTDSQRAAIAVKWSDELKKSLKQTRLANLKKGIRKPEVAKTPPRGKSRSILATQAGVSEHAIRQAESIAAHKPELLPKVESGEVTLADAQKEVAAEVTNPRRAVPALRSVPKQINLLSVARESLLTAADAITNLAENQSEYPRDEKLRSWELFDTAVKRLRDALESFLDDSKPQPQPTTETHIH